jgi:hypothetical protein
MRFNKYFLQDIGKLISILLILSFFVLALVGFDDPKGTTKILTQMGYTKIITTGVRPFARGENEYCSTGFTATSPTGQIVTGTVTKGWRGSTVRWD